MTLLEVAFISNGSSIPKLYFISYYVYFKNFIFLVVIVSGVLSEIFKIHTAIDDCNPTSLNC